MTHRCREDVRSHYSKVGLYPSFKIERGVPLHSVGSGLSVVSQLHLRLLNPWLEPYAMHGRDWSCTVTLVAPGLPGRTDCG